MRRIARAEKSFHLLRKKTSTQICSPQICSTCKLQVSFFSASAERMADAGLPMTEKIRRKIWGTDQPPGQEDPYGRDSYFDRAKQAVKEQKLLGQNKPKPIEPVYSENYRPANTWEGLEHVGEEIDVLDSEWLPGNNFKSSFVPKEVLVDGDQIKAALHRTLVEIFSLQKSGNRLFKICKVKPGQDFTMNVQIIYSKSGVNLKYPEETPQEVIIRSLTHNESKEGTALVPLDQNNLEPSSTIGSENGTAELAKPTEPNSEKVTETSPKFSHSESERAILNTECQSNATKSAALSVNYKEISASWDPSWTDIPITDHKIKLIIMKRMIQLTGIRIPDAIITATKTVGALLAHIIKPPKPRKLVEALAQNKKLIELPNVSVYSSRITIRDKEMAVGRWKLIEDEFRARGLIDPIKFDKGRNKS